jgi:ferredoxin
VKIALYYFTGTGNTEFIAHGLRAAFGPENPTELINIEFMTEPPTAGQLGQYDLLVFGAPVYSFSAPGPFIRFLRRLPPGQGRRTFLFLCPADNGLAAIRYPSGLLRRNGYDVANEAMLVMPGNCGFKTFEPSTGKAVYGLFGFRFEYNNPKLVADCQQAIRETAATLLRGERTTFRTGPGSRMLSALGRWNVLYWLPLAMKLHLRASRTCNRCGLCMRACPQGNITLRNGDVRFGWNCSVCFRCINTCPQRAIHLTGLLNWMMGNAIQYTAPDWRPPSHADRRLTAKAK